MALKLGSRAKSFTHRQSKSLGRGKNFVSEERNSATKTGCRRPDLPHPKALGKALISFAFRVNTYSTLEEIKRLERGEASQLWWESGMEVRHGVDGIWGSEGFEGAELIECMDDLFCIGQNRDRVRLKAGA
jgi:hypothetical protein